jgi:hypothetical protein
MESHLRLRTFTHVQHRVTALLDALHPGLRHSDGTLTVDLAELRIKCPMLEDLVDDLISTPITAGQARRLYQQTMSLRMRLQDIEAICRDLRTPLSRLTRALGEAGRLAPASQPRPRQRPAGRRGKAG